jgi:hypothetical protein
MTLDRQKAIYYNLCLVLEIWQDRKVNTEAELEAIKLTLMTARIQSESIHLSKLIQAILDHFTGTSRKTEREITDSLESICQDLQWDIQEEELQEKEFFENS